MATVLTMVFSWPSKAELLNYAYDRDSEMFSRDCFERVLSSIVSAPGAGRIHIVAHSMGTMLALESLRQLYARYGDTVAGRIGAVVFAAPDIDMDVFSSAVSRIGRARHAGTGPARRARAIRRRTRSHAHARTRRGDVAGGASDGSAPGRA